MSLYTKIVFFLFFGINYSAYSMYLNNFGNPDILAEILFDGIEKEDLTVIEGICSIIKQRVRETECIRDCYGNTPLHKAIEKKNYAIVELLLECMPENILRVNNAGQQPIVLAANDRYLLELMRKKAIMLGVANRQYFSVGSENKVTGPDLANCLQSNANDRLILEILRDIWDINALDREGRTLLQSVLLSGNLQLIKVLLQLGADPEKADKDGQTAIQKAMEILSKLSERNRHITRGHDAQKVYTALEELLFVQYDMPELHMSLNQLYLAIVKVTQEQDTAEAYRIINNAFEMVTKITNPSYRLKFSQALNHTLELLRVYDIFIESSKQVSEAAKENSNQERAILVRKIETLDKALYLMKLYKKNKEKLQKAINILLPIDLDALDIDEPIDIYDLHQSYAAYDQLHKGLGYGVALDKISPSVHLKYIKLLAQNTSINIRDNEGFTPLHKAIMAGNGSLIKQLLSMGARPLLRNKYGQTALDLAVIRAEADPTPFKLLIAAAYGSKTVPIIDRQ